MPFIPNSVSELRSSLGNGQPVSRFELAKMVGVTEQTIKNWEKGKGEPRMQMMDRLITLCRQQGVKTPQPAILKFFSDPPISA